MQAVGFGFKIGGSPGWGEADGRLVALVWGRGDLLGGDGDRTAGSGVGYVVHDGPGSCVWCSREKRKMQIDYCYCIPSS